MDIKNKLTTLLLASGIATGCATAKIKTDVQVADETSITVYIPEEKTMFVYEKAGNCYWEPCEVVEKLDKFTDVRAVYMDLHCDGSVDSRINAITFSEESGFPPYVLGFDGEPIKRNAIKNVEELEKRFDNIMNDSDLKKIIKDWRNKR